MPSYIHSRHVSPGDIQRLVKWIMHDHIMVKHWMCPCNVVYSSLHHMLQSNGYDVILLFIILGFLGVVSIFVLECTHMYMLGI